LGGSQLNKATMNHSLSTKNPRRIWLLYRFSASSMIGEDISTGAISSTSTDILLPYL